MTGAPITILVVDDEPPIRRLLRVGLTAQGYDVVEAADAAAAARQVKNDPPDLIILDLGLPDKPGHQLLHEWREEGVTIPVVILSSRTDEAGIVQALETGADDYVAKPFHLEEVLARIRALLRRTAGHAQSELTCGPVSLDTRTGRVSVNGNPIKMTSHEYRLLAYLMHHTGRVISRTELVEHLYDQDFDRDSNTIEVFVGRIRKKLDVDIIQTVRGLGYLLTPPTPSA